MVWIEPNLPCSAGNYVPLVAAALHLARFYRSCLSFRSAWISHRTPVSNCISCRSELDIPLQTAPRMGCSAVYRVCGWSWCLFCRPFGQLGFETHEIRVWSCRHHPLVGNATLWSMGRGCQSMACL